MPETGETKLLYVNSIEHERIFTGTGTQYLLLFFRISDGNA